MKHNAWCDASYEPNRTTVGIVIKDSNQKVIEKFSKKIINCNSCFEAECFGLIVLLRTIRSLGLKRVNIHTDSKNAVDLIQKYYLKNRCKEKFADIICEIIDLIDEIGLHVFNIIWVSRDENWEAHYMSKEETDDIAVFKIEEGLKLPYLVSNDAIKNYQNHCHQSSRNSSCNDLVFKINRAASLGKVVKRRRDKNGNLIKEVRYWNLSLKIRDGEVIGIRRTNKKLVEVPEYIKTRWDRKVLSKV